MRKHRQLACAATLVAALAMSAPAAAAPQVDTSALRNAVTYDGIHEHLAALQALAVPFEGGAPTRATGTEGHWNSVDYVVGRLEAAGYDAIQQDFLADIFVEESAAFARNGVPYPRYDGETGVWYTADFSGTGDATAAAVAVDFTPPTDQASASDSGCEAADFGPEVVGKIVLLQRGTCDFGLKVENAQTAGAVAAVIFNEGTIGADDRNNVVIPTLAGYTATIPVVGTDYATGRSLVDLANGDGVTLHVKVDGFVNQGVHTNNVIAESPGGRSDRTVVVGAHLDSVYAGPGINDDGSGTATLLETAEQMHELGISPRNKVRFMFFSGEEQGLLGSTHYASSLTKQEVQDISVMLDYDMLASNNYARFIYDGNGDEQGFAGPKGSGVVEQVFKDWWDSQDLAYETIPFDGRSDYVGFTDRGIPAGGIFAGAEEVKTPEQVLLYGGTAGVPFDPCYHQLCDTLANINEQGLQEHKDAAIHAIWTFAQTTSSVHGTDKSSSAAMKDSDWKGDKLVR